jgi:ketosteroid isomerase-like protein
MLEQLSLMHDGMVRDGKLLSKASGLSSRLEAYNVKALRNNSQIAEDSEVITPVLRDLSKAKQALSVTIATFLIQSKDTQNRILDSGTLVKILEDSGALEQSKRLGLGIEELVKEPFLEMQGKSGLIDIYAADFSSVLGKVQSAPVNEYGLFFQKLYAVAGEPNGAGIIMGLLLRSGNTFPAIFQNDPKLADAAAKLFSLFIERQEVARKNQSIIDERKARFDMVLNKVDQLIKPMQGDYDSGYYLGVLGRSSFISDVRLEYKAIGSTRQDVDDAFARLDKLVEDSRSKSPTETPFSAGNPVQLQAVRDLYAQFREAYEARDDSRIMSFMGDDWEAGDGATLSDMQVNLSRIFRKFDEMKMDIQNMQISPVPQGFMVTYDVTITSRIYKKNLRHQEKSAVSEQVSFGGNGAPRIARTLNGRYWLVE